MSIAQSSVGRLNLGCGRRRLDGFINVDKSEAVSPDLLWDLDRFPYPLPRGRFMEIRAFDVVEHLNDIPAFMEEVHALLAPGGTLEITTPHYSSANSYNDPTHRFHFGYFAFDVFTHHELDYYAKGTFDMAQRKLYFEPSVFSRLKFQLFNRYPRFYEKRLAWILPAWFMGILLRKS